MSILEKSIRDRRARSLSLREGLSQKSLVDISPNDAIGSLQGMADQSANRERYGMFRGHLYSAINAICTRAAGQAAHVGKVEGADVPEERRQIPRSKQARIRNLPKAVQELCQKSPDLSVELVLDGPLVEALEEPNDMQRRWQFVYSFVANLLLTGRGYVIGSVSEGELEFFSLPTSWIRPNKNFTEFEVVNPRTQMPVTTDQKLTRENVAFATLPNPSDPMAAMAPAQAQSRAIMIDEHIQTSQERFFHNGIFPSVVVTVGADPHPAGGGPSFRPRLSGSQRRAVASAIRKTMSGVANYGNPAIIDGMIERIDRLSATQNEMGWDKSEVKIRQRILGAFGVHPFILGEPVNVGGHAQAFVIEKQFCTGVNTYLNMLSGLMTGFFKPVSIENQEKIVVWWEPCEAQDAAIEAQNWRDARKNGDVTRNEIRHRLNLTPDESGGDRNTQFTPQHVQQITQIQKDVEGGSLDRDAAIATLVITMDLTEQEANQLIPEPVEPEVGLLPALPFEGESLEEAAGALRLAVDALKITPQQIADKVLENVSED
jgi:hypothetical protein